jgi:hypothetical protein
MNQTADPAVPKSIRDQERRDMTKSPQVRINVEHLDKLMELTDAQMRVWLYYKRREGADGKAFGKAKTIADWTRNLEPGTVRNNRAWLTRNGWLKRNGKSKSGLPQFLAVIPELHLDTPECHPAITPVSSYDDAGVIPELQQVSSQREAEVDNLEVPTKSTNQKDSVLTDGQLVSQSASETPSASPVGHQQEQHQNQTVPLEQVKSKTKPEIEKLAYDLGCNQTIPALLGLPYFYGTPEHERALNAIAEVLWYQDRTIYWLEAMVRWIKEHKFWSKRVHTGDRGVAQLAKHLLNMEVVEQFNAHLALTQGEDVIDPLDANYCYCLGRYRQAVKAPTASSSSFDVEEAE